MPRMQALLQCCSGNSNPLLRAGRQGHAFHSWEQQDLSNRGAHVLVTAPSRSQQTRVLLLCRSARGQSR